METLLKELNFTGGLMPAVIVDAEGGEVLTLCYMDQEALRQTLTTGFVHVFRRSKGRVMKKGERSGHTQQVREVRVDCEGNSLLFVVEQQVAACHAGYRSCYYRRYCADRDAFQVVGKRIFEPKEVYREGKP
jgi:phosphoribosyl-AMP cyclohydrolase